MLALDRAALGCDRGHLIDALVELGPVAVIRTASRVTACAARRDFGQGEVVGPVIASNADHARALIVFLFAGREGAFLRVDTDEDSGLGPWLENAGLAQVGSRLRMSRGARRALRRIRHKIRLRLRARQSGCRLIRLADCGH